MPTHRTKRVEFSLFAPRVDYVALVGSWNGWKRRRAMKKDAGGTWRLRLPLADGHYEYRFIVRSKSWFADNQEKYIADPVAVRLSPKHDNATIHIVAGQPVQTSHVWRHDSQPLPPNEQLIIYELHVGDFTGGPGDETGQRQKGRFQGVLDKLDYLQELGINAIELMPVSEFPYAHSWGYSQTSLYAVENTYGTPDELCRLVDECHARGIRVIQDAVYNHMQQDAPLTQIDYTYWFYRDNPDALELDFGPKFNYEFFDEALGIYPARQHVIGAVRQWVRLFHMDGTRFDCTRALKYFDLLRWFVQESDWLAGDKPFLSVAEHVPQDPAIAGPHGPMDAAWYENLAFQLRATTLGAPRAGRDPYNTGEVLRLLDPRRDGWAGAPHVVTYLDNHDHDRMMWLLGAAANTFDDAAFRRMKLGASLLLMAPGIPMIWMGQEFGESSPKTMDKQPLDWALLDNARNAGLFHHYRSLIALRKTNPALTAPNFEAIGHWPERGLLAFKRWNNEGNVIVVVANLKDQYAGGFDVSGGLEDGTWHEHIWNYDVTVRGGLLRDTLAESEVKIFIKR